MESVLVETVAGDDFAKVPLGDDEFIPRDKALGIDKVIDAAETDLFCVKLLITKVSVILNNTNKIIKPGRRANGRIGPLALKPCLLLFGL